MTKRRLRMPPPTAARGDRGSATAFGLFLILVVLVLAGAILEVGNAMSILGHATDIAQQAARADANQLNLGALRQNGVVQIDPAAATAAAAFLNQSDEEGSVTATPDQCTGWLRVGPAREGLVEVQAGWSRIGQYELDSADLIAAGNRVPDFEPARNARNERPLAGIVAAVAAARQALAQSCDPDGTDDSTRYHRLDET